MAAHQKPVGVDAVGRASDKRTQVFSGLNLQGSDVLRLDDQDAVNLVGQNLVEHADDERIAFDNLIEIGKQLCAGQSAMAGEDAVCAFAADRETCPVQMSDRDLQNGIAGAVVDRQRDVDGRNLDIAHDAGAADVQQTLILRLLLLGQEKAVFPRQQRPVIILRRRQQLVIGVLVQRLHVLRVIRHSLRGVAGVPVVADGRIQKQGHACKQHEDQRNRGQMFFHLQASP